MSGARPPDEVLAFYALGLEPGRLEVDYFPLERARTQELILRHLPKHAAHANPKAQGR